MLLVVGYPSCCSRKKPKAKAKVITSEKQLDEAVEVYERRTRQGLEHFPFETGLKSGFQKLGAKPTEIQGVSQGSRHYLGAGLWAQESLHEK